jgi:hypothetical protein
LFDQYFFDEQYEDSSLLIENQLVNKMRIPVQTEQ